MLLLGARLCRQDCAVNIAQTQCAAQLEQFGVDLLCGQGAHIYDLCRMSACQTVIHSLIHPFIKPSIHSFLCLFVTCVPLGSGTYSPGCFLYVDLLSVVAAKDMRVI